jgi:hypothetical protein
VDVDVDVVVVVDVDESLEPALDHDHAGMERAR